MSIQITFRRIHFRRNMKGVGSGQLAFVMSVDDANVDTGGMTADLATDSDFDVPEAQATVDVDITGKRQIVIKLRCIDLDGVTDYGEIQHTVPKPFPSEDGRVGNQYYLLDYTLENPKDRGAPEGIQACRQNAASVTVTTVSNTEINLVLEAHSVIPSPTYKPGMGPSWFSTVYRNRGSVAVTPASPINVFPNPSAVPILAPDDADADTRARIQVTYYKPNTMKFMPKDKRLEWTCTTIDGGQVAFWDQPYGLNVLVYGTAAGEALLEIKIKGQVVEKYRVIVVPLKRIKCRVTILNGTTAGSSFKPRSTPTQIKNHVAVANRFLRQLAVELVLDGTDAGTDGAAQRDTGIYDATVLDNLTRKVDMNSPASTRVNRKADVMNVVYIKSDFKPGQKKDVEGENLGVACAIPGVPRAPVPCASCGVNFGGVAKKELSSVKFNAIRNPDFGGSVYDAMMILNPMSLTPKCPNCDTVQDPFGLMDSVRQADTATKTVDDQGTPNTSNSTEHAPGSKFTISLMGSNGQEADGSFHAGLYITDMNGDPTKAASTLKYGNTLAHEFGHCLGLVHRIQGGGDSATDTRNTGDGMLYPPDENVMHWINGPTLAQDFDLIQVKASRLSPILTTCALP